MVFITAYEELGVQTLNVTGIATFDGTVSIGGKTTLQGALDTTGAATFDDTVSIKGKTTLRDDARFEKAVSVQSVTTLNGGLVVTSGARLNGIEYPSSVGTVGQVLMFDTSSKLVGRAASHAYSIRTSNIVTNTTLSLSDCLYQPVDTSTVSITITLPALNAVTDRYSFCIYDATGSANKNAIYIKTGSPDNLIVGKTTFKLHGRYNTVLLVADAANHMWVTL